MTISHKDLGLPASIPVDGDTRRKFRSMIRRAADRIQQGYTLQGGKYVFSTFSVELQDNGNIVIAEADGTVVAGVELKRQPKENLTTSKPLVATTATAVATMKKREKVAKPEPKAPKAEKAPKKQQLMFPNKERVIVGYDDFLTKFDAHLQEHHEKVACTFDKTWYTFSLEQIYLGAGGDPVKARNIVMHKLEQHKVPSAEYTYLIDRRMIGFGPVNKSQN